MIETIRFIDEIELIFKEKKNKKRKANNTTHKRDIERSLVTKVNVK